MAGRPRPAVDSLPAYRPGKDAAQAEAEHGIENAIKLALTHAVGRDPDHPVIDEGDAEFGLTIAWWNAQSMIASVGMFISDNEHEKQANDVLRTIIMSGEMGINRRDLRKINRRLDQRRFDGIMSQLQDEGSIEMVNTTGARGRPKTVYRRC